jgi:tRNA threonylcarbamoyladenosine biosynthesis protein TsaE
MDIEDEVSSPTYGFVNEYESPTYGQVNHFDLYRIESEEEAYGIGLEEYLDSNQYIFIEWAENIDNLLPDSCVRIKIIQDKDGGRCIEAKL